MKFYSHALFCWTFCAAAGAQTLLNNEDDWAANLAHFITELAIFVLTFCRISEEEEVSELHTMKVVLAGAQQRHTPVGNISRQKLFG